MIHQVERFAAPGLPPAATGRGGLECSTQEQAKSRPSRTEKRRTGAAPIWSPSSRPKGRDEPVKEFAGGSTPRDHVHLLPVPLRDGPDHGQGRPGAHWETIAAKGFQLVYGATANLFVDRHGDYIGYGPEAAELVGLPEPETFLPLPWDSKVARVWCQCFRNREEREGPGAFLTSDSRGTSSGCRPSSRQDRAHLRAGTEPEMMWLKMKEDGTPDVEGVTKPYCYHIDQFSELQPIIHKVIEYGQAHGLDMIQGDHEDAPGRDRAQLQLLPRRDDGRQPVDLPPDLLSRSVAS